MEKSLEPTEQFASPLPDEARITEPRRVRWLIKSCLKRVGGKVRNPDRRFISIMRDPEGWVWGVVAPESTPDNFLHPYLERYTGPLTGEDNLEVSQPLGVEFVCGNVSNQD